MKANDFQEWLKTTPEYQTLVFQHGERLFIQRDGEFENLTVRLAYRAWSKQQVNIDQLNNMEACYIEKKKQVEACSALVGQWREKRMGGCSDYARGGLHSRQDCTDDLEKALRGES